MQTNGGVWAWGFNGDGELGDGTTTNHLTPAQSGASSGMAAITLGVTGPGTAWRRRDRARR